MKLQETKRFMSRVGICELLEVNLSPTSVGGAAVDAYIAKRAAAKALAEKTKQEATLARKAKRDAPAIRQRWDDRWNKRRDAKDFASGYAKVSGENRQKTKNFGKGIGGAGLSALYLTANADNTEAITARVGNLQEGRHKPKKEKEDEIEMPKQAYKKEHVKLIKTLKKCKTAAAKQEAAKQSKEMKAKLQGGD